MNKFLAFPELATLAIVAAQNPEGFTFNLHTMNYQKSGYAVACKETQNSFGREGLAKVLAYCINNDVECVGGWYDSESGNYYFDATRIVKDREEAILLGRANDQLAIFDLDSLEEIRF